VVSGGGTTRLALPFEQLLPYDQMVIRVAEADLKVKRPWDDCTQVKCKTHKPAYLPP
jgi:hypothetical protein